MATAFINGKEYKIEQSLKIKNGHFILDGYTVGELNDLELILKSNSIDER